MSHRLYQINEVLRRELAAAISANFELPAEYLVTIAAVDTAADLQNATVWISVLPATAHAQALKFLGAHARELHAILFRAVRFRPVPVLHFRYDATEARAADIEQLLDQLPK